LGSESCLASDELQNDGYTRVEFCGLYGLGFRVQGLRFRVKGL